jgi:hypothetical protein
LEPRRSWADAQRPVPKRASPAQGQGLAQPQAHRQQGRKAFGSWAQSKVSGAN